MKRETVTYDVETYEIEDAAKLEKKVDQEKYLKRAEELGLKGLTELFKESGIVPFHQLSEEEARIWDAYCPYEQKLEQYNKIIPERVLDLIELCQNKNYFKKMSIFSEYEDKIDPVLIGYMQHPENSWQTVKFIIARWGESLRPWNEIRKVAEEKLLVKWKAKLERTVMNRKSELENVESLVKDWLSGGSVNKMHYWE